ncbi:MAG: glycosyltransferase, partial [Brachybacterium sp.]|nr:glycosyltransferase [Brachybacterium sp.]
MENIRPLPGPRPTGRALKVLLTTDWWLPAVNGVVASVTTLKSALERLGCEVRVLTLAEGLRSRHEDGVYHLGSVSASMIYDRARVGALRNDPIRREILDWGPDVIHSHCEFSTYVWARRLARELDVPILHTYHTIYEDYTHYYSPSRTVGRKVVAAFSRRVLAGTDAVIVPTAKVAGILRGYGVTRPIHTVPTGLDLERFRPARGHAERADAERLRASLGIPSGHTVALSLCRLAKEKNVEEVISHVAAAAREDLTLVIVGDGPYREELEAQVRDLGIGERVRFVGAVDPTEVPRYYRMADLFVSASLSETQGLTFIEAMACGLPLLCRRDASLAGVILDGITGWQFETAEEFALRLDSLVTDASGRHRMGRAGVAHADETCGDAAFGAAVLTAYIEAIERHHGPVARPSPLLPRVA